MKASPLSIFFIAGLLTLFASVSLAITQRHVQDLQAEAGANFNDSKFIVPNEFEFRRMKAFNQGTVDFNLRQIEALKKHPTFEGFLANLAGISKLEMKSALEAKDLDWAYNSKWNSSSLNAQYVLKLFSFAVEDNSGSFLSDPRAYKRIRDIALAGRMHAIPASLSGSKTMKALARALKSESEIVSVIDISNVPEYVFKLPFIWSALLSNIESLPLSSDALVVSTTNMIREFPGELWTYLANPVADFLRISRTERHGFDSMKEYLLELKSRSGAIRSRRCEQIILN